MTDTVTREEFEAFVDQLEKWQKLNDLYLDVLKHRITDIDTMMLIDNPVSTKKSISKYRKQLNDNFAELQALEDEYDKLKETK